MYNEGKKLYLIEEILNIENESVLNEAEIVIKKNNSVKNIGAFAGIWSEKEAAEVERIIEDSCEQINPDDWR